MRWLVVAVMLATSAAHADPAATFAGMFATTVDHTSDVVGWSLPAGLEFSHVVIGKYTAGTWRHRGVAILHCNDARCTGRIVSLPNDADVEVLGLVDLAGEPAPLSERPRVEAPRPWAPMPGAARMRWPALVVHTIARQTVTDSSPHVTETGIRTEEELFVISLARRDEPIPEVFHQTATERSPTGLGRVTTYQLARPRPGAPLDIVASETRLLDHASGCLPPKPFEYRFVLRDRRFSRDATPPPPIGCW